MSCKVHENIVEYCFKPTTNYIYSPIPLFSSAFYFSITTSYSYLIIKGKFIIMLVLHILGSAFAFAGLITAQVDLKTAKTFAVLGSSTVTNSGPSVVTGNLGVFPGEAITGFPPGVITNGVKYAGGPVANQARNDVIDAYNTAVGRPATVILPTQNLGGLTLISGVYRLATTSQLAGNLTLDGKGVSTGVWIFQIGTTLTTQSNSAVILKNGALARNIFWQVGSSATIGTNTTLVGNVLALTSITINYGARSNGGLYARNGAVSLSNNTVKAAT